MSNAKKYILNNATIDKKLERLALEIIENNLDEKELIFVGILSKGAVLAKNIMKLVEANSKMKIKLLTISFDKKAPNEITLSKEMSFDNKVIVIIDDVTNSGKVLTYALKPFLGYHPKKIQTLVLVERTHTLFPIKADYKGISFATTFQEHICVEVDGDKVTSAYLE